MLYNSQKILILILDFAAKVDPENHISQKVTIISLESLLNISYDVSTRIKHNYEARKFFGKKKIEHFGEKSHFPM